MIFSGLLLDKMTERRTQNRQVQFLGQLANVLVHDIVSAVAFYCLRGGGVGYRRKGGQKALIVAEHKTGPAGHIFEKGHVGLYSADETRMYSGRHKLLLSGDTEAAPRSGTIPEYSLPIGPAKAEA